MTDKTSFFSKFILCFNVFSKPANFIIFNNSQELNHFYEVREKINTAQVLKI